MSKLRKDMPTQAPPTSRFIIILYSQRWLYLCQWGVENNIGICDLHSYFEKKLYDVNNRCTSIDTLIIDPGDVIVVFWIKK